MPVVPPAPATFPTTICWPRVRDMWSPTMRAMTSVGPPAANGTTMVIGRCGKVPWAWAGNAARPRAAARERTSDFFNASSSFYPPLAGGAAGADRPLEEGREVASRQDQGPAQVLLHQFAEHEAEQHRRRLEAELDQRIDDEAKKADE